MADVGASVVLVFLYLQKEGMDDSFSTFFHGKKGW